MGNLSQTQEEKMWVDSRTSYFMTANEGAKVNLGTKLYQERIADLERAGLLEVTG